jgi:hypothetical protein
VLVLLLQVYIDIGGARSAIDGAPHTPSIHPAGEATASTTRASQYFGLELGLLDVGPAQVRLAQIAAG